MSLFRSNLINTAARTHTSVQLLRSFTTSRATPIQNSPEKDPQLGDYPQLPPVSLQLRKWSPKWWDPLEKRNFGETLHEQDDALSVWAPDEYKFSPRSALFQVGVAAAVAATFISMIFFFSPQRSALPKTFPRNGLALELGGPQVAAPADGAFSQLNEDEDDE